jgi:hypothetical protein
MAGTAHIDKSEPLTGQTRAALAALIAATDIGVVFAYGLDSSGRAVRGAGQSGIKGIFIAQRAYAAGEFVDLFQDCDVVEFPGAAGSNYYADGTTGALTVGTGTRQLTAPVTAGSLFIGFTVEAASGLARLVVRLGRASL